MATVDISDDYQYFDNAESVTVTLDLAHAPIHQTVASALRGVEAQNDNVGGGRARLTSFRHTFFLPSDLLDPNSKGLFPQSGDLIAAADGDYRIDSVSEVRFGSSVSGWNCVVFKQPERQFNG